MTTTKRYTLISAATNNRTPGVPGVKVSDPDCPINIHDHPGAVAWAEAQGWGLDDPDELVYVLDDEEEAPAGFPLYRIEVEAAPPTTEEHELLAWLGDWAAGLSDEQLDTLRRVDRLIAERWPDEDDADVRRDALSGATQYMLGDSTLEDLGHERIRAVHAEASATAAAVAAAVTAIEDGTPEHQAAREVNVDRMTIRKARGLR